MIEFTAVTGLTLYVAPSAGHESAVVMTEDPAGTYTADADAAWPVFVQLGESPDAADTQLTLGASSVRLSVGSGISMR